MPFNGWNIPSICKMIQIADTIVFQYLLECKPIFFAFSRQRFQSLPFRLFGLFFFLGFYGAQNEAYMSRSAEKWVRGLCFNELGVGG